MRETKTAKLVAIYFTSGFLRYIVRVQVFLVVLFGA